MQFRNWLNRTSIAAIPPDERASFKAQITEIKAKLDEWEQALSATEPQEATSSEPDTVSVSEEPRDETAKTPRTPSTRQD
jgi:hypothetical protein